MFLTVRGPWSAGPRRATKKSISEFIAPVGHLVATEAVLQRPLVLVCAVSRTIFLCGAHNEWQLGYAALCWNRVQNLSWPHHAFYVPRQLCLGEWFTNQMAAEASIYRVREWDSVKRFYTM
jgi:hypothetical protein